MVTSSLLGYWKCPSLTWNENYNVSETSSIRFLKLVKRKKGIRLIGEKNSFETFLRRYWLFIIKRKITKWTHQDQSLHGPKGLYEGQNYQGPIRRSIDPTKGQAKLFDISPKFVFERVEIVKSLLGRNWINVTHYVITYCPSSILQSLNQNLN